MIYRNNSGSTVCLCLCLQSVLYSVWYTGITVVALSVSVSAVRIIFSMIYNGLSLGEEQKFTCHKPSNFIFKEQRLGNCNATTVTWCTTCDTWGNNLWQSNFTVKFYYMWLNRRNVPASWHSAANLIFNTLSIQATSTILMKCIQKKKTAFHCTELCLPNARKSTP